MSTAMQIKSVLNSVMKFKPNLDQLFSCISKCEYFDREV